MCPLDYLQDTTKKREMLRFRWKQNKLPQEVKEERSRCAQFVREKYQENPNSNFHLTFDEWPNLGVYAEWIMDQLHKEKIPVSMGGFDQGSGVSFDWPFDVGDTSEDSTDDDDDDDSDTMTTLSVG